MSNVCQPHHPIKGGYSRGMLEEYRVFVRRIPVMYFVLLFASRLSCCPFPWFGGLHVWLIKHITALKGLVCIPDLCFSICSFTHPWSTETNASTRTPLRSIESEYYCTNGLVQISSSGRGFVGFSSFFVSGFQRLLFFLASPPGLPHFPLCHSATLP